MNNEYADIKYVNANFDNLNEQHKQSTRAMSYRYDVASPLSEFLGISVAAGVLFYGGWLQLNGELGMDMPAFVELLLPFVLINMEIMQKIFFGKME